MDAQIEIQTIGQFYFSVGSHFVRMCGLKYPLNENTSRIWERLLFQSAVKPVESFDDDVDDNEAVFKVHVRKIKICSKKNRKV